MATKMTKKEAFTAIINILDERDMPELKAFMEHQIELLNSSSNALKKPTENQLANNKLMDAIVEYLSTVEQATIPDITKAVVDGIKSGQHCNSLLIKLRKAGKVKCEHIKKVAYFSLGSEDAEKTE